MNYQTLENFALSPLLADFKLQLPEQLGSKEVPAHRIILASNSTLFKNLFEKDEKCDSFAVPTPRRSIKGPVSFEVFEAVLRFGYQEQTLAVLQAAGLSETNAFLFFSAARELDFATALRLVSEFIEQRYFAEERLLEALFESLAFEQEGWVFSLVQKISQRFDRYVADLDHREELLRLPFETLKALLVRDDLKVEGEDSVYKLVIDYIKQREQDSSKENTSQKQESDAQNSNQQKEQKKQGNDNQENQQQQESDEQNPESRLTKENKKELFGLVRLSFVSHQVLMESVKEKALEGFQDLVLEAISAKLSRHEHSQTTYSILLNPRDSYGKGKQPKPKAVEVTPKLELTPEKSDALHSLQEYESLQSNFLDNSHKKERLKKVEFIYSYDLDENGALFWLGSLGRQRPYKNPYAAGRVKVFFSSISENSKYDFFVGRKIENCRTSNQQDSYMGVDFGERRLLVPKQYTLRNRDSIKHTLLNWSLEGSLDYKHWFELDRRIHFSDSDELNQQRKRERNSLLQKGALTTWAVDLKKLKGVAEQLTGDVRAFKGFRFFRIKQVGKNSSGEYNLVLSGFELYGTGYGEWFFEGKQKQLDLLFICMNYFFLIIQQILFNF